METKAIHKLYFGVAFFTVSLYLVSGEYELGFNMVTTLRLRGLPFPGRLPLLQQFPRELSVESFPLREFSLVP